MRRIGALAGVIACLALPAASRADAVPAYTPVGPPEALETVVFATDGTMYGATGFITRTTGTDVVPFAPLTDDPVGFPSLTPAIWRSTDHGHAWTAVYRAPAGSEIAVLAASPADPGRVFASVALPEQHYAILRIDGATGTATALPFDHLRGVDAAGTAYGVSPAAVGSPFWTLVRCPATGACDSLPLPGQVLGCLVVDPDSAGVLASTNNVSPGRLFEVSTDGGATWAPGAPVADVCSLGFAGPAPRTLYALHGDELRISHDAGLTAVTVTVSRDAGLVLGSRPSTALRILPGEPVASSIDDGATLRPLVAPLPTQAVMADPLDPSHVVVSAWDQTEQSWDGGATWSELHDARFGTIVLPYGATTGSGRHLYAETQDSIWASADLGATWRQTRPAMLGNATSALVARDDPLVAYVAVPAGELRTSDGGSTWKRFDLPPLEQMAWLPGDDPSHLIAEPRPGFGGADFESTDGGSTWAELPAGALCSYVATADAAGPTGQRLQCAGATRSDPPTPPTAAQLLRSSGTVRVPGRPGVFAISSGRLLGELAADGTWSSALGPTGAYGPTPAYGAGAGAWPSPAGTIFYAYDFDKRITWARRGAGRWWRLQEGGRDLAVVSVLDATHVLVRPLSHDAGYDSLPYEPLGVLDLAHPALAPPQVQAAGGGLTCAVPWPASDARASGFQWRRDGSLLQGTAGSRRAASKYDRGHRISCAVTATTSFGSVTLGAAPYRVPGAPVVPPRPRISGSPRIGGRLRCSATAHVSWYRGTAPATPLHARTYVLRPRDAGHAMACQTRLRDGTVTRSRTVRVAAGGSAA